MGSSPLPRQEWLTPKEIAAFFQVSVAHIYKLLRKGEIQNLEIGTVRKVRREDFDAYLRAIEVGEKPKPRK